MGNRRNMKKVTGILCAGVLILSLSGCGSAYANEAGRQSVADTGGGDMLKTSVNAKENGKPQSDAAVVELAKDAAENQLSGTEIKKSIGRWRGDHHQL